MKPRKKTARQKIINRVGRVIAGDRKIAVLHGDAEGVLRNMPEDCVDCVVTSPPYWGQRDYGESGQIGNEADPRDYLDRLEKVFGEVRRVLAPHGTLWLNIGDVRAKRNISSCGTTKGDLLNLPLRVCVTLEQSGWRLRQRIIWHKPDAMPGASPYYPRAAHEDILMLTPFDSTGEVKTFYNQYAVPGVRTVWKMATSNYKGSHFAVFPEELPRRCIQLSMSPSNCLDCGTPHRVMVEKERVATRPARKNKKDSTGKAHRDPGRHITKIIRTWSEPDCDCGVSYGPWPGVVLDPFCGSGTTLQVAREMGYRAIGIDLAKSSLTLAKGRIAGNVKKPQEVA